MHGLDNEQPTKIHITKISKKHGRDGPSFTQRWSARSTATAGPALAASRPVSSWEGWTDPQALGASTLEGLYHAPSAVWGRGPSDGYPRPRITTVWAGASPAWVLFGKARAPTPSWTC